MRRAVGGLAALAIVAVLILAAAGWPGRDYRNGDFFQYYAGATAVVTGVSPYDTYWWTEFSSQHGSTALHNPPQPPTGYPRWTTPYPLYLFVAIAPIALLPLDMAASVWLVAQAACVIAGLAFVARPLLDRPRRDGVVLAAIAIGFQPLWLLPVSGNLTGFLFGAVSGAVGLTLRSKPRAAGALLAICAVKPQSLVFVAIAIFCATPARSRVRLLQGAGLSGVPLLAAAFALQPSWVSGWLSAASALQRTQFSNATGWTVDRVLPGSPAALAPISVAAVVAFFGVWLWRVRPAPAWVLAAAVPVSVFVAPHGWTYEQLHLLLSAAVAIAAAADRPWRSRAFMLAGVAAAFGPIPWALYVWDFNRNGEEASAAVPLVVFGLVLLAHRTGIARPTPWPASVLEVPQHR